MAADVSKNLERAKKFLEKNRVEDAIEAYLSVLEGAPQHLEATQALGTFTHDSTSRSTR